MVESTSQKLGVLESAGHRGDNFIQSIVLFFVGILLVLLVGPYLIYQSEFQYNSENFAKAIPGNVN